MTEGKRGINLAYFGVRLSGLSPKFDACEAFSSALINETFVRMSDTALRRLALSCVDG
jgi:hypothetical protein